MTGLVAILLLATGMVGGGGRFGKSALRAEIRLKFYNEAIGHYEKAKALFEGGRPQEALQLVNRALRVISEFPEAYDLRRRIYLELGEPAKAGEEGKLFERYGGGKASLYKLRELVVLEIAEKKKHTPPPDIQPAAAYAISGGVALACILGMIYEYRRLTARPEDSLDQSVILERFPGDETAEVNATWLFKGCGLLLPAPFFFALLVFLGFRHYSNLLPLFLFSWVMAAVAVYLIFFADLRGLGEGLRRGRGGGAT